MAQWNNGYVKGLLDVGEQYLLSDYKYNVAKLDIDSTTNNHTEIIADENIDTTISGSNITIKSLNNDGLYKNCIKFAGGRIVIDMQNICTIGTANPPTENAQEGQIYFKIIT